MPINKIQLQNEFFPEMVYVPGEEFLMGTGESEEGANFPHLVNLENFEIGKTEVTVLQYQLYCMAKNKNLPKDPPWGRNSSYPIVWVSWDEAMEYTDWLELKIGHSYRLPTEAEWEYAALGGRISKDSFYLYSGNDELINVGWYNRNSEGQAHEVALKSPNALGLFDMSGNVYEWCHDRYDEKYYSESPYQNPFGPLEGKFRVIRGGSWDIKDFRCRITYRDRTRPHNTRKQNLGFRVVRIQ